MRMQTERKKEVERMLINVNRGDSRAEETELSDVFFQQEEE